MKRIVCAAAVLGALAVPTVGLGRAEAADPPVLTTDGDYLCVWDVPNQVGGVCVPSLQPVIDLIDDTINGSTGRTFSL